MLIIISFINPAAKERVFDQTISQMNLWGNEQEAIHMFSKQHAHHYITAYRMFLDNKILGVGVKNFRNFCSDEKYQESQLSCSTHPHNTYIQILAETGIIGFLFLLTVLFYFCKYVFQHLFLKFKGKSYFTDFEICVLSGIVIYLWPFVPTGSIFTNWLSIVMIVNVPFLIWSRESNKT
jgi:O-antigen ligase